MAHPVSDAENIEINIEFNASMVHASNVANAKLNG